MEEAASAYSKAQAAATRDDRLEVEVDFHWVGEPNISFFVELALAGWVRGGKDVWAFFQGCIT